MISARGELDSLIQRIPRRSMALPGASGGWSIKDIIAHLNSYDRWLALGLALRAQKLPDFWIEDLPLDEFNSRLYQENHDLPLGEVLKQSKLLWNSILEETRARLEEYLFSEQSVQRVPYAFRPCEMLKSESYGHYLDHVPDLKRSLETNEQAEP